MKRQIIKTRSQKPYVIVRIIIIAIVVLAAFAIAFGLWRRARQDFHFAIRNTQTPLTLTLYRHEHLY